MNNIYFPVHVVALLRRLVNVMATFSLSGQSLISRVRTEDTSHNKSDAPDIITTSKDSWWSSLSRNKWDWFRVGSLVDSVLEQPSAPIHPHRASEGSSLYLAFTNVNDAHAVIVKQVDTSSLMITEHGFQVYLMCQLRPTSIMNCHRRNYHLQRHLNPSVIQMIQSIAYCEIQHCMTRSEPRGSRLSSATVSSCESHFTFSEPHTLIYRAIRF